jgi:hypothetical protein
LLDLPVTALAFVPLQVLPVDPSQVGFSDSVVLQLGKPFP